MSQPVIRRPSRRFYRRERWTGIALLILVSIPLHIMLLEDWPSWCRVVLYMGLGGMVDAVARMFGRLAVLTGERDL